MENEHAWACVTFVSCGPDEAPLPLPAGPMLAAQGTRLSRTLETLSFLVARRLLERQGGSLTSMVTAAGHGVLRLALPVPSCPAP
jgi:hypothetical protein